MEEDETEQDPCEDQSLDFILAGMGSHREILGIRAI